MAANYHHKNIRGCSFKEKNLEGANFSEADIRGTNFTGAKLRGANFTNAKAGLQKRSKLLVVLISLIISGIAGFLFLLNGVSIAYIFDSDANVENRVAGWVALTTTIIIYVITIHEAIGIYLAFVFAVAGAFAITIAVATTFTGALSIVAGAFAIAVVGVFAVAAVALAAVAVAFAITVGRTPAITIAFVFAVAGAFAITVATTFTEALGIASVATGFAVSGYVAWEAMKRSGKYEVVEDVALVFAAIGGTSFHGADLTDANFTSALLTSTDLRTDKLIRTCFQNTKLLDRVLPGTSYLQYSQVRQLILTGQGQDKNFDHLYLRGINLKAASLTNASFIGTDLSEACLQDAELSRAKLVQTQLDNTDLTGANLTGAIIEDWNITKHTKLHGVRCEFVYMRSPTKDNLDPLRKPDNNKEKFADGDFENFIQPFFDTLDLYHNQNVDPRAIATAFKELAENNPQAELEIVSVEKRGDDNDKILLRAKTATTANKSKLSREYFINYNKLKALAEKEFKALIAEKELQINRLANMISTTLESPTFYIEKQRGTIMTGDNITQTGNIGVGVNKGEINTEKLSGTINEATSKTLVETAEEIQQLLEQLDKTYSTETTTGKMTIATEAINRIDNDPIAKQRVLSALKAGSIQALAQLLNHPAASFVIGALEDWQKGNSK